MRHFYKVGLVLLPVIMLALSGCSSSSTGSGSSDPFAGNSTDTGAGSKVGTIFGNVSTATGRAGITLTTDRATVDVNNGQVLVTAKIVSGGAALAGVPVSFSIVAPLNGPATIEAGLTTVTTDSNGTAVTRVSTGNTLSTTNVIVSASAVIGAQHATANTTFQIVRGTGIIAFGSIPVASANINPNFEAFQAFQQQIPIKLTDANGNPRVGAAVTLSVYTNSGTASVVFGQPTIVTDASGAAIFNATVSVASLAPGLTSVNSIIFKAATGDAVPVVAYAAGYYSLTSVAPNATLPTITLTTDRAVYDSNSGVVTATAKVFRDGLAVSGVPVTFTSLSGPVTAGYATPVTDKNGLSVATFTIASSTAITEAIIQATTTFDGNSYIAYTQFQVNGTDPTALPIPTVIMTLTPDITKVDANNGTVALNANLIYGADYLAAKPDGSQSFITHGTTIPDLPVTFTVIAGPATITGSTLQTDKNGNSKAILTTGNSLITTDVIVQATTVFDGKTYRAYTTIQLVRGTGVIAFVTTAIPSDPSGTLVTLSNTEKYNSSAPSILFRQLIPFKVTDSNGNPRVGVPVTLNIYSQSGSSDVVINFLKNGVIEPTAKTVTTDSAGSGIFNVTVTIPVPVTPGLRFTDGIVYQAVTNDTIPLTAYGGFVVSSYREPAPDVPIPDLMASPATGFFAATDVAGAALQFTISGGTRPYTVTASNPARVSVTLQPDGVTAIAILQDASQWTGTVSFSVLDAKGVGAKVTPLIHRN